MAEDTEVKADMAEATEGKAESLKPLKLGCMQHVRRAGGGGVQYINKLGDGRYGQRHIARPLCSAKEVPAEL